MGGSPEISKSQMNDCTSAVQKEVMVGCWSVIWLWTSDTLKAIAMRYVQNWVERLRGVSMHSNGLHALKVSGGKTGREIVLMS